MRHVGWVVAVVVAISLVGAADPVLDRLDAIDVQLSGLSITLGSVSSLVDDLKINVDNVGDRVGNLSLQLDGEANAIKGQLGILDGKANLSLSLLDDLRVNVDNVHTSLGGLSDQLAAEADEIKIELGEGFGHTSFLVQDFGEALVQMNQQQNSLLQVISDNTAADHDSLGEQMDEGLGHAFFLLHDYGEALVQMNQGQNVVLQTIIENDAIDHDEILLQIGNARQTTWNAAGYIEGILVDRFNAVDGQLLGLEDRLDVMDAKLDQLLECCATLGGFEGSLEEVIALLNYIIDTLPPGWDKKATH